MLSCTSWPVLSDRCQELCHKVHCQRASLGKSFRASSSIAFLIALLVASFSSITFCCRVLDNFTRS